MKEKIIVKTKDELKKLIEQEIAINGPKVDLNHLNVSNITDMSFLFSESSFNGQMSQWDVSNVNDMKEMFFQSQFNQDISNWDVSNVENMKGMFANSKFNQDLSNWDISNVQDMNNMFSYSQFNQDLTLWTPLSLTNSFNLFNDCICPKPYWAECNNNEELKQKITNYQLKQKLEEELNDIKTNKKIKL